MAFERISRNPIGIAIGRSAMPRVMVREDEDFRLTWSRFKRACTRAGLPREWRRRRFYEKPARARKRKRHAAARRRRGQSFQAVK
jgi:ribosomal protein S21